MALMAEMVAAAAQVPSRRRRAYVSGPYRAGSENEVFHNILTRRAESERLWRRGIAAFCPHMNTAFMDGLIRPEAFIEGDLAWLECADIVTYPPDWEQSEGTRQEVGRARLLGLEVVPAEHIESIPTAWQPQYEPWYISRETHWRTEPVTLVVVHHEGEAQYADTPAAAINRYHIEANGWGGIGYHVWVRKSGLVEIGRPLWAVGAHAKNHNSCSWGICLDGNFNVRPPEPVQLEVLQTVLRYFELLAPGYVLKGHRELPGMVTDCPGKLFPLDWLRTSLGKEV